MIKGCVLRQNLTPELAKLHIEDPSIDEELSSDEETCLKLPSSTNFIKSHVEIVDYMQSVISQESVDSAFTIVDLSKISSNVRKWRSSLPRVDPLFQIACNSNEGVLSVLQHSQIAFSSSSKMELNHYSAFSSDHSCNSFVIDSCFASSEKYITHAIKSGVNCFVINSLKELKCVARNGDSESCVYLNLSSSTSDFGMSIKDASLLMSEAKKNNVIVSGVSYTVNANLDDSFFDQISSLSEGLYLAKDAFALGSEIGFDFTEIILVGGLVNDLLMKSEEDDDAQKIICALNSLVNNLFPQEDFPQLTVLADASTALVTKSACVAVHIEGVKFSENEAMYYVDDGIYGSFHKNMIGTDSGVTLTPRPLNSFPDSEQLLKSTVWGPTCDSLDIITNSAFLPRMEAGDWMFFEDCAAYSINNGTAFNGVLAPSIRYVYKMI